jgi:hypothetical protein
LAREAVIRDPWKAIEIVAALKDTARMLAQQLTRVVAVRVIRDKRCAPFKGAHDSVFIALRKMAFARAYQASEQDSSVASQSSSGEVRKAKALQHSSYRRSGAESSDVN